MRCIDDKQYYVFFLFVYFQLPFKEEFIAEMKFILKFEGNTKIVRHGKSESVDSRQSLHSNQSDVEPDE